MQKLVSGSYLCFHLGISSTVISTTVSLQMSQFQKVTMGQTGSTNNEKTTPLNAVVFFEVMTPNMLLNLAKVTEPPNLILAIQVRYEPRYIVTKMGHYHRQHFVNGNLTLVPAVH